MEHSQTTTPLVQPQTLHTIYSASNPTHSIHSLTVLELIKHRGIVFLHRVVVKEVI